MEVKKIEGEKIDVASKFRKMHEERENKKEISVLYGHLIKMRKQLKRNLKRTQRLHTNFDQKWFDYLASWFLKLDKTEQRLVELKADIGGTIREHPELLQLIIVTFGPQEDIEPEKNEAV